MRKQPSIEPVLSEDFDARELTVVPLRHYAQWVGAVVVLAFLGLVGYIVGSSKNVEWGVIPGYLTVHAILKGVVVTLEITAVAMLIGTVGGTLIAVMRLSRNTVLHWVATSYVLVVRSIPQLVQILMWYNIALFLPRLGIGSFSVSTNAVITPFAAAVLGLGLNEIAYMAEIVRAGILAIEKGQTDAALSLGYTPAQTTWHIVLPQAMRVIIPPMSNETIGMLKATSLVSVIGASDLLTQAENISSGNFLVIELLIVACIWYFILTTIFSVVQYLIERHLAWGANSERFLLENWLGHLTRLGHARVVTGGES
jgi:polar amino acid transport system permease protein